MCHFRQPFPSNLKLSVAKRITTVTIKAYDLHKEDAIAIFKGQTSIKKKIALSFLYFQPLKYKSSVCRSDLLLCIFEMVHSANVV